MKRLHRTRRVSQRLCSAAQTPGRARATASHRTPPALLAAPGRLVALSAPFFTRVRKVRGVPGPGMVGERHARAREGVEWAALARCGVQDAPGQTTRVPDSESKAFYDIDGDREAQDGDSGAPAAVRVAAQMCGTGAAMLSTLLRSLGRSVWEPETLSSMR